MLKHPRNLLFLLLALIFCSPTFAEVKKWKDESGITHYGDAPILAGTARVKIDEKADKTNAERIFRQTEATMANDSFEEANNSAKNPSRPSGVRRSPRR